MKLNLFALFFVSSILLVILSTCSKNVERVQDSSFVNRNDNLTDFENFITFTEGEVTTKISDKNSVFALAESSTKEVLEGSVTNVKLNSGLFMKDNNLGIQIGIDNVSFDKKSTAVDVLKSVFSGQISLDEINQFPFAEIFFEDEKGQVWSVGSEQSAQLTVKNKGVYEVDEVAYVVVNGDIEKLTLKNGDEERMLNNISFQLTYSLLD